MKARVPLQVDPEFRKALRKLQGELMSQGENKSLRELTADIVNAGILTIDQLKQEIRLKMDERKKFF